jgi:hypothetical protein
MIAFKLLRAPPAILQSKVEDILGNADANHGDVILISSDRKYFMAHRLVLVWPFPGSVINFKAILNAYCREFIYKQNINFGHNINLGKTPNIIKPALLLTNVPLSGLRLRQPFDTLDDQLRFV